MRRKILFSRVQYRQYNSKQWLCIIGSVSKQKHLVFKLFSRHFFHSSHAHSPKTPFFCSAVHWGNNVIVVLTSPVTQHSQIRWKSQHIEVIRSYMYRPLPIIWFSAGFAHHPALVEYRVLRTNHTRINWEKIKFNKYLCLTLANTCNRRWITIGVCNIGIFLI